MSQKKGLPEKVAEKLASGGTLREEVFRTSESKWTLSSSQKIDCPHCQHENQRFLPRSETKLRCSRCQKEIRILRREEVESPVKLDDDDLIRVMLQNKFYSVGGTTPVKERIGNG